MIPKPDKMYQMHTKCAKWSKNIPNVCKTFQMAIKYKHFPIYLRHFKIYQNWDFLFENKPSGNPAFESDSLPRKRVFVLKFN
jgi:hypothetical protein